MKNSQIQALAKFTRLDEYNEPDAKHTQKYYRKHANRYERHVANNHVCQMLRKQYVE